jgi:hypothetical protein
VSGSNEKARGSCNDQMAFREIGLSLAFDEEIGSAIIATTPTCGPVGF